MSRRFDAAAAQKRPFPGAVFLRRRAFAGAGVALTELHEARANLEEVFLELTAYDKPVTGKGGDAQ